MYHRPTTLESRENRLTQYNLVRSGQNPGKIMKPDQRFEADRFAARFRYAPGETPLEGYTIQRGIGIGGFGEVYFAVSNAGKEVALKRIQRNLDVELRGVQNCLNLKHLNLISLFDIRTDEIDDSWVVMEYVPGPSLRDIIEVHENGMPGHQIERWFAPIASGVAYLHDSGLVHRDLKPANIFLDEDEDVIKIGDYGLSKFISNSHRSGQTETVGTFHYMAPEIGKGIYGKGVDIYAMGIVLYEMLTGTVPFHGESSQEIIMKHLTADPDLSSIPFDFREAIRRSLIKDPEKRFRNIEELNQFLPWSDAANGAAKEVLNSRRFVIPTDYEAKNSSVDKRQSVNDVFERSATEAGILFGPLKDSVHGSIKNEIRFVESTAPAPKAEIQVDIQQQDSSNQQDKSEEPIAHALKITWSGFADWVNDSTVSTPLKVLTLVLIGLVVTANSQWLLPVALGLGFVYLLYFGVRNLILSPIEGELQPKKLSKRKQRQLLHEGMRQHIRSADFITQATAITGGFLTAAIVCIALNLLGLAISEPFLVSATNTWAIFAWSTLISVLASWSLLSLGKIFERSDGDWFQRRVAMLILGVFLGTSAFFIADYFNVNFAEAAAVGINPMESSGLILAANPFVANILFFACIFVVLRWWKQVDPTRGARLSIWTVGLCLIWAAIIGHLLDFVPMLSCLIVVVVSISVQLSSNWISPWKRKAISDAVSGAHGGTPA